MTREKTKRFDTASRLKKFIVVTGIFVSLFGGMFAAIIAINNFKNYYSPYLFGFTFGAIGLVTGLFVAKKIKSEIVINQKMLQNYYVATIYIATGFIGLAMLLGQSVNTSFAIQEKSDSYNVVEKIFRKGGRKQTELNILVINVDGVFHNVISKRKYWQTVGVGTEINVCLYKGLFGFRYLTLTDEN